MAYWVSLLESGAGGANTFLKRGIVMVFTGWVLSKELDAKPAAK